MDAIRIKEYFAERHSVNCMSHNYNICQFIMGAALSKKDQPGWKHIVPESSLTEGSYKVQI